MFKWRLFHTNNNSVTVHNKHFKIPTVNPSALCNSCCERHVLFVWVGSSLSLSVTGSSIRNSSEQFFSCPHNLFCKLRTSCSRTNKKLMEFVPARFKQLHLDNHSQSQTRSHKHSFFRMTSINIDLSSWITLYIYIYIYIRLLFVITAERIQLQETALGPVCN
jgi:hypothetical protein